MKNRTIVLRLLLLGAILGVLTRFIVPLGELMRAQVFPPALIDSTNRDRTLQHLSRLTIDPKLMKAARLRASDMASRGYFAHESPEGRSPWYWLDAVHYRYSYAGENLALDFNESDDVEEAWMESTPHRGNILSGDFTDVGVAVATGTYQGRPASFVVQFFGKR